MPEPTGTNPTPSTSGGEPAGGNARAATEPRVIEVSRQEKNSMVMRLVGEHGSETNALLYIAGKVIRYQKRAQEAERQTAEMRKVLPPKDAVILTGDEAKAFAKLREQKVDLVKLPDTLKEAQDLATKVTAQERKTSVIAAAGKKWKANVLEKLLGDSADGKTIGLPIEFKDTMVKKEDGSGMETVRVAYVKEGNTSVLLDTWMETVQKDWVQVARVTEEEDNSTSSGSSSSQSSGDGSTSGTTQMPKQTATGSTGGSTKAQGNLAVVDRVQSKYVTPGQRAAAEKK